jgi:hypothetical protein
MKRFGFGRTVKVSLYSIMHGLLTSNQLFFSYIFFGRPLSLCRAAVRHRHRRPHRHLVPVQPGGKHEDLHRQPARPTTAGAATTEAYWADGLTMHLVERDLI